MPLSGTFDSMPLTDVIQWIHNASRSGTLTVSVELDDTYLVFEEGEVVAVGSADPLRLDLAHALLARRAITEEQLLAVLSRVDAQKSVMDTLVETGIMSDAALSRYQVEHVFELVLDLFLHDEGSFHFSSAGSTQSLLMPTQLPEETLLRQPISTQRLLLDAIRQLDEWQRMHAVLPNSFVILHALEGASDNPVWRAMRHHGEMISLGELCLRVGRSRFWVHKQLFEAYQQGLV
ncbi:MAG: DUF4388 domain-containing protein, partial [bacterium]